MRHKHYDVLIAIANGQDVEFYSVEKKMWFKPTFINPLDNHNLQWRVKKEPVITVKYFQKDYIDCLGLIFRDFQPDLEKWDLKVTYEDGIAIKAELPTRTK
jgi:hypothetical protein